jgi:hypothetical protein
MKYNFSAQSHSEKLKSLAAYHAAMATSLNKDKPGYTDEAAFHWEAATHLVGMANLLGTPDRQLHK